MLTRGSMSLSVEDGGLPPKSVVQDEDSILADSARLIDRFHDADPLAMTQIALAPCSPFSVTRGLMQASAELARARGVLLHTHLAETEDENAFCEATFGCRPLGPFGWGIAISSAAGATLAGVAVEEIIEAGERFLRNDENRIEVMPSRTRIDPNTVRPPSFAFSSPACFWCAIRLRRTRPAIAEACCSVA